MEKNETTIKTIPHKIEQSMKINTKTECTHRLTGTTTAAVERQRKVKPKVTVTSHSTWR